MPPSAFRIFDRICEAVAFAHSRRRHPPRPQAREHHARLVRRGPRARLGHCPGRTRRPRAPSWARQERWRRSRQGPAASTRAPMSTVWAASWRRCSAARRCRGPSPRSPHVAQAGDAGARYADGRRAGGRRHRVRAWAAGRRLPREPARTDRQRLARRNRNAIVLVMVYLLLRMLLCHRRAPLSAGLKDSRPTRNSAGGGLR